MVWLVCLTLNSPLSLSLIYEHVMMYIHHLVWEASVVLFLQLSILSPFLRAFPLPTIWFTISLLIHLCHSFSTYMSIFPLHLDTFKEKIIDWEQSMRNVQINSSLMGSSQVRSGWNLTYLRRKSALLFFFNHNNSLSLKYPQPSSGLDDFSPKNNWLYFGEGGGGGWASGNTGDVSSYINYVT